MPSFALNAILLHLMLAGVPAMFGLPFIGKEDPAAYEQEHTTWVYPPWQHTWGIVRGTETHLDILTLGRATFVNPQGLDVVRLAATDDPDKRGDDVDVTVYGVNSGENAIIYNRSMRRLGLFGYDRETRGLLDRPYDVAATTDGQVFVTDTGNRRVVKLRFVNGDLEFVTSFGQEGEFSLVEPLGIEATAYGTVLVADAGRNQIVLYDTLGTEQYAIGGFEHPIGLAAVEGERDRIDTLNISVTDTRYIAVSDSLGRRLTRLTFDGDVIARRPFQRDSVAFPTRLTHLEIDYMHNVVATDCANHQLLKFTPELDLIAAWGQRGSGRTRFEGPTGLAIWRPFGQTFVAEQGGAHYLWVGVDVVSPPRLIVRSNQTLYLDLNLTERAVVDLDLVDATGDTVRSKRFRRNLGPNTIRWGLTTSRFVRRSEQGWFTLSEHGPLPGGEYTLHIRLFATYSSPKAFSRQYVRDVYLPAIEDDDSSPPPGRGEFSSD